MSELNRPLLELNAAAVEIPRDGGIGGSGAALGVVAGVVAAKRRRVAVTELLASRRVALIGC